MSQPAQQSQLDALEQAILARARDLAEEFKDKAERQRDKILRDAAERLHMAEEREVLIAKAEAERHFRRVTQANELKMQARLDQLRWEMVQSVQDRLAQRMQAFRTEREAYRNWLIEMLAEAAHRLPPGDLTAEVTAEDLSWVTDDWAAIRDAAAAERSIALSPTATWGSGGIKVRLADNSAQLDNRFEGRLARYEALIQRAILRELFPTDLNVNARSGGPQ